LVQQRVGAFCTDIHAQARHLLRLAAQGVSISGLAQQAPSSGAQQRCQLPAGGMGGAPTGRQPIDQAVAVDGEGRQEFVPGIRRSSQAGRFHLVVAQHLSTGSLSLRLFFSLFPISLSLSFLPAFLSCPLFICLF
jgi:hypothetical protein